MDIDVYRPGELSAADRAAWTALQSKAHLQGSPGLANPFLSPEFTLAVGRYRRGVRIAVVRERDEPVAFLPYQRTAAGCRPGRGPRHLGRPGPRAPARIHLGRKGVAALLRARRVGVRPSGGRTGAVRVGRLPWLPLPVLDVDQGYETYLAQLRKRSPKFTRTTLAKERRLHRAASEVRYVHDERDPAVLRTLMGWKSAQYRRTGRSDRFAHQWISGLVRQLFHTRSDSFAYILSVLYADGKPVAAHFGLRTERVLACWFPAYDPEYATYSPGLILHLRMAEAAAADGIAYLDLGRGHKEYKDSLKTRELTVSEGWVTRRHPIAALHRVRRVPVRALRNAVVTRPELFEPADRFLKKVGKIRTVPSVTVKPTKT